MRRAASFDVVIGAIHSRFDPPRVKQTDRVLRAMDERHFMILAHPSCRLIGTREGIDIDLEKVIRRAAERRHILELNSQPERLDLPDQWCQVAKAAGVLINISSDAHSVAEPAYLEFGIDQARRGWLEAPDVVNTRGLAELRDLLRAARA